MINFIQDRMIQLFSPFIPVSNRFSDKTKYRVITGCFVVEIVLFCIVRYMMQKANYFYNTCLGMGVLFIILFFSLDKELKRIHWHRSVWIAWFGFAIAITVSDCIVWKQDVGFGLLLAFVFVPLFFVWQNHSRRDLLWKTLKDAIKISFLIMALLSFLFRPYFEGGRYAGIFTNPNMFGLYLYVIFCVYMSDLDWFIQTNRPLKKQWFCYVQMALTIFYISLSQARTSMMAVCAIILVWLLLRSIINHKNHKWKPFFKTIGCLAVFCVVLYPLYFKALMIVPDWVGHPIVFADDTLFMSDGSKREDVGEVLLEEEAKKEAQEKAALEKAKQEAAKAEQDKKNGVSASAISGSAADLLKKEQQAKQQEEMADNNILTRLMNSITNLDDLNRLSSGRITIYKEYISKLNYAGHEKETRYINNHVVAHAHNNWIQYGYTYGIFGMFFYGIITVVGLIFSIHFYMKGYRIYASYSLLPLAIIIGYLAATLTECLFMPFGVFPAFAFWFVYGELFIKHVPKNRYKEKGE